MTKIPNPQIELAYNYVYATNKNIFLTGKAGTGKTTFLQNLKKESIKRIAVVAPTGVAAINAGGMTIHSFFQLPFGPMIPGQRKDEIRKKRFSKKKINLVKSLDLLVIDEISMVRADVLDAIDEVLRRYRDYSKPFGGLQLLMVGDLHQLPPVVRNEEWQLLRPHYETMYFFGSLALQKTNPVTIELKHIYRQSDNDFIQLLNKVRNNQLDQEVLNLLNSRYQADFQPKDEEGYITLTSHNASAHKINMEKLVTLPGRNHQYRAKVEGKFPDKAYPTDEILNFKVGAQVMFVKNDLSQDKLYYNGKIGRIIDIDKECIMVRCKDDGYDIPVRPLEWNNMKYTLDEKSKELKEEVLGTFTQIPLKTAWAITIHKSQGLTFERAIIDAEAAFAHGQVYVALSRCKSFEGIVLRSQIGTSSVKTDQVVRRYSEAAERDAPNEDHLLQSKQQYQQSLLRELFDFKKIQRSFDQLIRVLLEKENAIQGDPATDLKALIGQTETAVISIAQKFLPQLQYYFNQGSLPEENEELQARIRKASHYFSSQLKDNLCPAAQAINILSDNQAVKKLALEKLSDVQKLLFVKMQCFESCSDGFVTNKYIRANANAELDFQKDKVSLPKVKVELKVSPHPELYQQLAKWRADKADELDLRRYQVLPNKTIIALTACLPTSGTALKRVSGMGPKRVEQFGIEILQQIIDYCDANEISEEDRNVFEEPATPPKVKKPVGLTKAVSLEFFNKGMDIDEIARNRNLKRSTIEGHLRYYVGQGELDIFKLIEKEKVDTLMSFFKEQATDSVAEAKIKFGETYSYEEIRTVVAHLRSKSVKLS